MVYWFILSSFFCLTALGANRFLAINLHLRYKELISHKRVVAVVISFLVLSTLLSLAKRFISYSIEKVLAVIVVFCLLTTALLNYKSFVAMRRLHNQIQPFHSGAQTDKNFEIARIRKFASGTFILHLAFLNCYLPRLCTLTVTITYGNSAKRWLKYILPHWFSLLLLSSSSIIYCWKMRHSRHTIMNRLRSFLCFISFGQSVINWYTWFHYKRGYKFFCLAIFAPCIRESKTVLDSGFHAVDSGFQALDSNLCQWNLDSEFPTLIRFRTSWGVFWIPKPRIQSGFP